MSDTPNGNGPGVSVDESVNSDDTLVPNDSPEPRSANDKCYRLELFLDGKSIGWLGADNDEWAVVRNKDDAMQLSDYLEGGVLYIQKYGRSRWMAVSTRHYVGFYKWAYARGWEYKNDRLYSNTSGCALSVNWDHSKYLYCWDKYSTLTVKKRSC
ncbi:MAG: hypothetical protein D3914_11725 [Candidatus Electrothrix sp. LOE2]|nr:hypothetical protein [Candidatus Electrothrix sp. LOE2]